MERLTPEREVQIRAMHPAYGGTVIGDIGLELLHEIDVLRTERNSQYEFNIKQIAKYAALEAERDALLEDKARLEYAMAKMFIVTNVGPQTRRIYASRAALDAARKEGKG